MTADRTAALEAIDKALYPNHTTQWPFDALKLSRAALLSTAKEADRMREALEEIRECSRSWGGTTWVYNRAGMLADAALLPFEGAKT